MSALLKDELMKVAESYNFACHDWIISERSEELLLDHERIVLLLQDILHLDVSPQLMEYLLYSIAYMPTMLEGSLKQLTQWLNHIDHLRSDALFKTMLRHANPRMRVGVSRLIAEIGDPHLAEYVIDHLNCEQDSDSKRAMLHCLQHLDKRLPHDIARKLVQQDSDWVVQSYALSHLPECIACLLITDGTDFATELGRMADEAGFELVTIPVPITVDTITARQHLDTEIMKTYDLVILVKGEHYMRATGHGDYSYIRQFVREGGNFFATSWVCWENAYNDALTDFLPFFHLYDTYHEHERIMCHPTDNALAHQFFPEQMSYVSSFELLQGKDDTVILLETDQNIPLFGFHRFGKGMCYYFNTCQHYCFGKMPSPFETNAQLSMSFQRVFQWIFDTLQHDARANK